MRKIASTIFVALISFSFFSFANSADKKLEKILEDSLIKTDIITKK